MVDFFISFSYFYELRGKICNRHQQNVLCDFCPRVTIKAVLLCRVYLSESGSPSPGQQEQSRDQTGGSPGSPTAPRAELGSSSFWLHTRFSLIRSWGAASATG